MEASRSLLVASKGSRKGSEVHRCGTQRPQSPLYPRYRLGFVQAQRSACALLVDLGNYELDLVHELVHASDEVDLRGG